MGGSSRTKVIGALNSLIGGLTSRALAAPKVLQGSRLVFSTLMSWDFLAQFSDCSQLHERLLRKVPADLLSICGAAGRDLRKNGDNSDELLVLQERIELSTSPLPRECSTTELLQHPKRV
jgi:hypothetical protein